MSEKEDKFKFLRDALDERRASHRLRELKPLAFEFGGVNIKFNGQSYINFSSNDYLGLRHHPLLIQRAKEYADKYGVGSGASRLVTGTLTIHSELEKKLADVFGTEAALLFNSGYQANTTVLPALADRNSLILADKKVHNSLIQGALLSNATFKRFKHNKLDHLEKLLQEASESSYNRIWIVTETVFSMDGDRSDLASITQLAEQFNALLYIDDAHGLGVLGKNGLGLSDEHHGIDIRLGAFGKAFGGSGAFVACSEEMKQYLINYASGFIYSTAMSPTVIGALDAALELIPSMNKERADLHDHIEYFRNEVETLGWETGASNSAIIPMIVGEEEETLSLSNYLLENGLWVSAIRPPTVEKGASRIRITLTTKHTKAHIDQLLKALGAWKKR